jgi:hypothetical protein
MSIKRGIDPDIVHAFLLRVLTQEPALYEKFHEECKPNMIMQQTDDAISRATRKIFEILKSHKSTGSKEKLTIDYLDGEIYNLPDGEERDAINKLMHRFRYDEILHRKAKDEGVLRQFLDYLRMIVIKEWTSPFSEAYQNKDMGETLSLVKDLGPKLERISLNKTNRLDASKMEEEFRSRALSKGLNNMKLGIAPLDGQAGYIEPQTLNIFIGPTGRGKSMMGITLVKQAVMQGRYVHVAVVEDKAMTYETRLMSALTGIPINKLKAFTEGNNQGEMSIEDIKNFREKIKLVAEYVCVDYIYGESIARIHQEKLAYDQWRALQNLPPYEVDIVDYTGHIAHMTSTGTKDAKIYDKIKLAYNERKNFALKYNKIAFDFVQVNREGNKKAATDSGMLTEADLAGAYDISHVCDTIISINASDQDWATGKSYLYISKGREGGRGRQFEVNMKFECGHFDMESAVDPNQVMGLNAV